MVGKQMAKTIHFTHSKNNTCHEPEKKRIRSNVDFQLTSCCTKESTGGSISARCHIMSIDFIEKHLEAVHKWDFDVFKLHNITNGRPLAAVTYTILQVRQHFLLSLIS